MAGNRELAEIGEEAVLQIRIRHGAPELSSTLASAPVPWSAAHANHQTAWLPDRRSASKTIAISPAHLELRHHVDGGVVMGVDLPLAQMSVDDKLQAMELLWADLSSNPAVLPSHPWHGNVLRNRREQVLQGKDQVHQRLPLVVADLVCDAQLAHGVIDLAIKDEQRPKMVFLDISGDLPPG
ncbi:MAG: addiction module protein [Cyanobacteriota bacterium]|nr:addiction module protein [Cyanobacteriota bacterium]